MVKVGYFREMTPYPFRSSRDQYLKLEQTNGIGLLKEKVTLLLKLLKVERKKKWIPV